MGSNLVLFKILDGNGLKAMPGLHPILVHSWKNIGSQMGQTKKTFKKECFDKQIISQHKTEMLTL